MVTVRAAGCRSILDMPPTTLWDDYAYVSSPLASPFLPSLSTPLPQYSPTSTWWREPSFEGDRRDVTTGHTSLAGCSSVPSDREPYCFTCGQIGHYPRSCMYYRTYVPSSIVCLTCGKYGHYASSCPMTHPDARVGGSSFFPWATSDDVTSTRSRCIPRTPFCTYYPGCPCTRCTPRRAYP